MLRRRQALRAGVFVAMVATIAAVPRVARADDDVISLEGLPPELLEALTGSTMSPDVLVAMLAAAGSTRAAQQAGAGATTTASGGASAGMPIVPSATGGTADARALSGLLDGAVDPAAAGATRAGGVVDVRHPGDAPNAGGTRRGPERIRSGGSGGLVELHPAGDAPEVASEEPVVVAPSTTLPPVRIDRARGRHRRRTAPPAHH